MKNRGLFLSLLLLFSLRLFSQINNPEDDFEVSWGLPYDLPKKYNDLGYIGNMVDGILQICLKKNKEILIQRFDLDKFKATNQIHMDISKMPDRFVPDLFTRYNGNFYMFYSTWDKAREKEQLFVDEIDITSGTFADDPILLIEANKIVGDLVSTGFYKFSTANKYDFHFSIDTSVMLVTYRKPPRTRDDSKNRDRLGFFVFDKDLNLFWGDEFRMPYTEKMMDNTDFMVDSKGNAYLLCKVYEGRRTERDEDNPNYHYEILKFGKDYTEPKQIVINLDDKFINDLYISEDLSGGLICAGYYRTVYKSSNKGMYGFYNTDGAFIVKINENDEVSNVQKGYYELPADIISQYEKQRTQNKIDKKDKKDEAEASSLKLRKILIHENGSYTLVGEEYLIIMKTTTSSDGKMRTTYKYFYGDIYVMKIDEDGELAWVRKIPKNQEGKKGRGGMSYKHFWYNDNNYFLYLDNIKNLHLTLDKVPYKHLDDAGGYFMVSKIDKDGTVSKGKLFNLRKDGLEIWPADIDLIAPDVMVGRALNEKSKQSKMMKIEFKH